MADPFDPNQPPLPPDDLAAHAAMVCPGGLRGFSGWYKNGVACTIEDSNWRNYVPLEPSGLLKLDPSRSIQLALLHSREYQFRLEELYLAALALSLDRFEFQLQWYGGNSTDYFHFGTGSTPLETNTLTTNSNLGFSRAFSRGGQLLVDASNSFVWEFTGTDTLAARSNLAMNFVQPLLRFAGKNIRLEALTQAERNVLYAAREFARFRKQFYIDVVAGVGGFQSLLVQLQNVRNVEANLQSLDQELRAHEALAQAGVVSPFQVDQVFQNYQDGELMLIRARNDLQTSLDQFKIQLGLPPNLPVELDDTLLRPFQFSDPSLMSLDAEVQEFQAAARRMNESPRMDELDRALKQVLAFHPRIDEQLKRIVDELNRWQIGTATENVAPDERARWDWRLATRRQVTERLARLYENRMLLQKQIHEAITRLPSQSANDSWKLLHRLLRQEVSGISDLFVLESQIRSYLVDLPIVSMNEADAVQIAAANRLDLMNEQARVVDEWRKIQVAANQLKSQLDVRLGANVGTTPGSQNPVDFSAAGTSYSAGFRFDGPLNRMSERNLYRQQLIEYQRSRRSFMSLQDSTLQSIRLDLRQLDADRLNFEIARQRLIVAARQVEMTRAKLRTPDTVGDASTTLFALNALESLLDAKNALVGIWVSYETNRLLLLFDTDLMQVDAQGTLIECPVEIPIVGTRLNLKRLPATNGDR